MKHAFVITFILTQGQKVIVGPYWHMLVVTYLTLITITVVAENPSFAHTNRLYRLILKFFRINISFPGHFQVVYGVIPPQYPLLQGIGLSVSILNLVALTLTAFVDPGVFPRHTRPLVCKLFDIFASIYRLIPLVTGSRMDLFKSGII